MLEYLNVWVMWSPISKLLCRNCCRHEREFFWLGNEL